MNTSIIGFAGSRCRIAWRKYIDKSEAHRREVITSTMTASALTTFMQKVADSSTPVSENEKRFSEAEVIRAKMAKICEDTFGSTPDGLTRMLRQNKIDGAMITPHDVETRRQIYGTDPISTAVTARSRPPHVTRSVRPERKESIVIFADIMFVAGMIVLLCKLSTKVKLARVIKSRDNRDVLQAVLFVITKVEEQGYTVTVLHTDREPSMISSETKSELLKKKIKVVPYAPAAHVVDVESIVRPTRQALIKILLGCQVKFGYHAPSFFLQAFLDHFCIMNSFTLGADLDGMTPGEHFFGRKVTWIESCFVPGSLAISKIPVGTQKGKNVLQGEPVIFLGTQGTETLTCTVYSFGKNQLLTREINELQPLPFTLEARNALNALSDAEKSRNVALDIPSLPIPSHQSIFSPDEVTDWLQEYNRIEAFRLITHGTPLIIDSDAKQPDTPKRLAIFSDVSPPEDPFFDSELVPMPMTEHEPSRFELGEKLSGSLRGYADARRKHHDPRRWRALAVSIDSFKAYNLTVDEALEIFPTETEQSVRHELNNLLNGTFNPVDWSTLDKKIKVLPSKIFVKAKYSSEGTFEKVKSRIVGGGHRQDRADLGDISAPTISLTNLFALVAIAAYLGQHSKCADVPSAYLNA